MKNYLNLKDRNIKYQIKLFLTTFVCLWSLIGLFAYLEYRNVMSSRTESISARLDVAVGNLLDCHDTGGDMGQFIRFMENYLEESTISDMCMSIYDTKSGKLIHNFGPGLQTKIPDAEGIQPKKRSDGTSGVRLYNVKDPEGNKLLIYDQGISEDGQIEIFTWLPKDGSINKSMHMGSSFWLIVLFVGVAGSVLAWVLTSHQAKNIYLLRDFAERAAADREFIPMGDFPSDEIGDISRQIVAIYNSRTQANVRREREHIIALKATEEKNNLKREMTNNISHELKTPIGIIRSYLDMILNTPEMDDTERNYFLTKAKANVERLVSMMNDLSTMTRLEESNDTVPLSDIDFHDLVFNLAEDLTRSGVLGEMELFYNIPLDSHVEGNGELLIGVLSNLARNAVAYSQGTRIDINQIARNDNFYTFSFADNGVGVGPEHLEHIFERFYRIDKGRSRKVGGTGLGLPIVKSSINTMGGSITVRNRKSGGLEFIFTLRRIKKNFATTSGDEGTTTLPQGDSPVYDEGETPA